MPLAKRQQMQPRTFAIGIDIMGLAEFIRSNEDAIIAGWEDFARTYLPSAENLDREAIRDHIIGLLRFIADDLETPETERERSEKAKGQGPEGEANTVSLLQLTPISGSRRALTQSR